MKDTMNVAELRLPKLRNHTHNTGSFHMVEYDFNHHGVTAEELAEQGYRRLTPGILARIDHESWCEVLADRGFKVLERPDGPHIYRIEYSRDWIFTELDHDVFDGVPASPGDPTGYCPLLSKYEAARAQLFTWLQDRDR